MTVNTSGLGFPGAGGQDVTHWCQESLPSGPSLWAPLSSLLSPIAHLCHHFGMGTGLHPTGTVRGGVRSAAQAAGSDGHRLHPFEVAIPGSGGWGRGGAQGHSGERGALRCSPGLERVAQGLSCGVFSRVLQLVRGAFRGVISVHT